MVTVGIVSPQEQLELELNEEAKRLHSKLQRLGWTLDVCRTYAPLTLEINRLKQEKNAVILAHSYMTPDIIYGVADFSGDSLALAEEARKTGAATIVLAGVRFMAETAKILNPEKKVLLPSVDAGCSLSESITAGDVRKLRTEHPNAGVVTYVNTSAEVKAESDACCTSANALQIIEAMPQEEIIFLPDVFMAKNLAPLARKKIIGWHGECVVHRDFSADQLLSIRERDPGVKILAHQECPPAVAAQADFVGGTSGMVEFVRSSGARKFAVITECGLGDRLRVEFPEKDIVGACGLCPYMKKNSLPGILQVLKEPRPEQVISVPEPVRLKAKAALDKMFEFGSRKI